MVLWTWLTNRLARMPLGLRLAVAAIVSGLLARATVSPFSFWPGALVTYVPPLLLTASRGSFFSASAFFLAAFFANCFGFSFVAPSVVQVAHQSWPVALLLPRHVEVGQRLGRTNLKKVSSTK